MPYLNFIALFFKLDRRLEKLQVVAPTNGARRAAQRVIDRALPRTSFSPQLEVLTTYKAFGVGFAEEWSAPQIIQGLQLKDRRKTKAAGVYVSDMVILDEGSQTVFEQVDEAEKVFHSGRMRAGR